MTKLDAILHELEPELRQALLDAFDGIRKGIDMPALRDAVERMDVDEVERLLDIDESSFLPYVAVATLIYMRSGAVFSPTIGGRFNALAATGSDVIRENVNSMIDQSRRLARDMTVNGMGRRDVAKRIRDSIGLTNPQQSYVDRMRMRLESGDASELRAILKGQTLRDKRYDPAIKRAIANIEAGKPSGISARKIEEMTAAYKRKMIRKRAEDVAKAEAEQYQETAKYEAAKQRGGVIRKTWRHSRIWLRARPDHVGLNGESVLGIDTPFSVGGTLMQYAHDPAGGARHNANCRCRTTYKVEKEK